jgi:hypothetical protein
VVEDLTSKHEALSSNPSTAKKSFELEPGMEVHTCNPWLSEED